jgi:hypothetical protein
MTREERLKLIFHYDGWLKSCGERTNSYFYFSTDKRGNFEDCLSESDLLIDGRYLESLDWLHPVAMKIIDELESFRPKKCWHHVEVSVIDHKLAIKASIWGKPVNYEYIDLFNAVTDAIQFLNELKTKQQ